MHRRFAVAVALWGVTFAAACPETYGKKGALDDAMEEDIEEQHDERLQEMGVPLQCGDGKSPTWRCEKNQPDTCHWECTK